MIIVYIVFEFHCSKIVIEIYSSFWFYFPLSFNVYLTPPFKMKNIGGRENKMKFEFLLFFFYKRISVVSGFKLSSNLVIFKFFASYQLKNKIFFSVYLLFIIDRPVFTVSFWNVNFAFERRHIFSELNPY